MKSSSAFLLRMEAPLHVALKKAAAARGCSINEFCVEALRASLSPGGTAGWERVIAEEFGSELLGIALFGSAARGELTESSDVDLLVAVREPVHRGLYRKWDESARIREATTSFARVVNPQFVQMPSALASVGGIWLEAAMEGRVVWDPSHQLHPLFSKLRTAIVEGEFIRGWSHGHPYWTRRAESLRATKP